MSDMPSSYRVARVSKRSSFAPPNTTPLPDGRGSDTPWSRPREATITAREPRQRSALEFLAKLGGYDRAPRAVCRAAQRSSDSGKRT